MADDIDIAQELEAAQREAAIANQRSLIDIEREHISKLESKGVVLHCKYCESEVEGYTSRFCDKDCRELYEELAAAEKRNHG